MCIHTILFKSSKGTRLSESLTGERASRTLKTLDRKVLDGSAFLASMGKSLKEIREWKLFNLRCFIC